MRTILSSLVVLLGALPAQELRLGIGHADAVLVGRDLGKTAHDEQVDLHRVQVLRSVRGADGQTMVTVLDWPQLAMHNRPVLRQSRLYCLQDASAAAARLGLPAGNGPYYKLVGWAGSCPLVGAELDRDPVVAFAALLAAADAGARPSDTADALCRLASAGKGPLAIEATRLLAERGDLRAALQPLQWSQLVARASGEVDQIDHKIALAELAAEQRVVGLLDTLAVSLGPVRDAEYARVVGRIGKLLEGENATVVLQQRLQHLRDPGDRSAVLLAIGATNTDSALQLLLRLDATDTADAAVVAALREHKAPVAREAAARRK
jgi:hypothetical protein